MSRQWTMNYEPTHIIWSIWLDSYRCLAFMERHIGRSLTLQRWIFSSVNVGKSATVTYRHRWSKQVTYGTYSLKCLNRNYYKCTQLYFFIIKGIQQLCGPRTLDASNNSLIIQAGSICFPSPAMHLKVSLPSSKTSGPTFIMADPAVENRQPNITELTYRSGPWFHSGAAISTRSSK